MEKFARKCVVCGKEYTFCPNRNDNLPRWHLIYCGDNCRNIWNAITAVYDKEGAVSAAQELKKQDLSHVKSLRADVQRKIEKIFNEAAESSGRDGDLKPVFIGRDGDLKPVPIGRDGHSKSGRKARKNKRFTETDDDGNHRVAVGFFDPVSLSVDE